MRATLSLLQRSRKHALTTKRHPNGYYKGTRTGKTGTLTKHGRFIVDYNLVRTYVVPPSLTKCGLTPFVPRKIAVVPGRVREGTGPMNGERYLARWKESNSDERV